MSDPEQIERTKQIVESALEVKAERPIVLDVSEVTSFADIVIVLSGRSDRQVRAIVDAIRISLRERGEKPLGIEGYSEGRWVLIDLDDLIVHVFAGDVREHYDIERLWSDAPQVDLGLARPMDMPAETAS